jgi:hypothetical protein
MEVSRKKNVLKLNVLQLKTFPKIDGYYKKVLRFYSKMKLHYWELKELFLNLSYFKIAGNLKCSEFDKRFPKILKSYLKS